MKIESIDNEVVVRSLEDVYKSESIDEPVNIESVDAYVDIVTVTGDVGDVYVYNYESGSGDEEYKAGAVISGHRCVMLAADGNIYHADSTNVSHAGKVIGMSVNAAGAGETVYIRKFGKINNPGWGLTPGALYFFTNLGQLTTEKPASGFSQLAGIAIDSDNFEIQFFEPMIL